MAFEKVGVRAVIEGLGRFNRDARIINRRLKEVTRGLTDVDRKSRKTGRGMDSFGRKLKGVSGDLLILGGALTAVGVAGGAFLFTATQLAARVETLGVVTVTLGKNVGKTKDEIRDLEQAVVSEGITLRAARKSIALMIQSNIDLANATNLATLAQNAAVIAGINSSEAFERLVFVITSGNVRMARTLGLQVSFQDAYKKTAEELGKTTLELTQQEKVGARTNAVLAAGTTIVGAYGAAMETAGKKVTSLPRHIERARRELGEQFLPIYGAAIDLVTASLKSWSDLDEVWRRIIASSALVATSTGLVLGNFALLAAAIPRLVGALGALSAALGITLAALGAVALAIGAVVAAGILFINFTANLKQKQRAVAGAIEELSTSLLRSEATYKDYRAEIERVNDVIEQQGFLGTLLTREIKTLTEAEFNAAREALAWHDAQLDLSDAIDDTRTATENLAGKLGITEEKLFRMAEAAGVSKDELEKLSAEEFEIKVKAKLEEELQKKLQGELDELQLFIDTDVTIKFADFQEAVEEINQSIDQLEIEKIEAIAELEARGAEDLEDVADSVDGLNDRIRDQVSRLGELNTSLGIARDRLGEMGDETDELSRRSAQAGIDRMTTDIAQQKETIAELRAEMAELQGSTDEMLAAQEFALSDLEQVYLDKMRGRVADIDEVTAAWSRQTAEILFNLATQRLGIDGFTREELQALTKLAGPEGLGLIDEAGVALIETIDEANAAMERTGDQSGLFAEDMVTLAGVMTDPKIAAEELAEAIRDVELAMLEFRRNEQAAALIERGLITQGVFRRRQRGGPVRRSQPYLVGETGEELFIPNQSGIVLPSSLTTALSSFLTAATSAIPIAGAGAPASAAAGGTTTQEFNMSIHTSAPIEPIIADFNLLALMGERRG